MRALFLMLFARMPKRKVERVSASLYSHGEQLMMSVVRELPPSDSCRILQVKQVQRYAQQGIAGGDRPAGSTYLVSFESRYGICELLPSVKALMTIPSADKLLLIFLASSSVCPLAPVFPTFSEPARSTRYRLPVFCVPVSVLRWAIVITKMEWEREDSAFMSAGEEGVSVAEKASRQQILFVYSLVAVTALALPP